MAKFRFKVADPHGKVKVGQVGAPDEATARSRLEEKGFTVVELAPVEGTSLEIQQATQATPRIERAETKGYQPGLLDYIEDIESQPQRRNAVLGFLAVVGVLVAIFYGVSESRAREAQKVDEPTYEKVVLAIKGRTEVAPRFKDDASIIFHFPEVPLDLERAVNDITADDGTYQLDYEFESQRSPTYVTAELRVKGKDVDKTDKTLLSGDPKSAQLKTLQAP